MPSPFPGTDPYLEDPGFWGGFLTHLVIHICEDLQARLLPGYASSVEQREATTLTIAHRFVTVRDTRSHEVVTILEVLSPWSKMGDGRNQ